MEHFDAGRIKAELAKPVGERLFGDIICASSMDNIIETCGHALKVQRRGSNEPVAFIHNNRLFIIDDNKRDEQDELLDPKNNPIDFDGKGFASSSLEIVSFEDAFGKRGIADNLTPRTGRQQGK